MSNLILSERSVPVFLVGWSFRINDLRRFSERIANVLCKFLDTPSTTLDFERLYHPGHRNPGNPDVTLQETRSA